ncbi:MAG: tRNA (adenosine(37)-N6)-threonylcarbamoyltransferase complex dimerization subunit type 1 TsaB [Candidatus Omnitrophica bacterium]|nr:tRNA (adenosine(37)-N6)-threonylcarbamoyltransferase complex dimerization subunit type 1 TsaB [Candidatus Omnitrophota bacterium]
MKILGIDTSSNFLCVGIAEDDKICEYNLELAKQNSNILIPTIKRILEVLGWDISEIDYLACGLGPGSFTGIRVGLSTIKGMAWALNKPIIGISSLEILARNVKIDSGFIMPIIDAKRNLVYTTIYKIKNTCIRRISPYMLLDEESLLKKIKKNTILLGDGLNLYNRRKLFSSAKGIIILDKDYWYLKGFSIILSAKDKIDKGELSNPFDIKPIYLYPKECQIKINR